MNKPVVHSTLIMLKKQISAALAFISLEGLVRQIEILFVAGVLYYILQRTGNIFSLIFFLAILALDFLHMLRSALDDIDESADGPRLYAGIVFAIGGFVFGVMASVTIAVDFAGLQ